MIDVLSTLEPGISNSVTNVKFEYSVAQIARTKQQMAAKIFSASDAGKLINHQLKNARDAFDILLAGSEGRSLLEKRFQYVITQSSENSK